jgi:diamine N-acetyltransferase
MPPVVINKALPADVEQLQTIGITTFLEAFLAHNSQANMQHYVSQNLSMAKLKAELENPESAFYFAMLNNRAVGYLKLNHGNAQSDVNDPDAVEIERIYTLKEFYGKGVGQQLFQFALDIAAEGNYKYLWLGVWDGNPRAIRFYEKNGFAVFGSHSFWLGDDEQTDILMRLEL